MEPLILEMMAEVKEFNLALLEAHHDGTVDLDQARLVLLELDIVLTALRCQVYIRNLGSAKWLQLVNHNIEPDQLHLDLRVIGRLPNHNLVSLVQRKEN